MLPWRSWTLFSFLVGSLAFAHVITAILAAVGSAHRSTAWRVQSIASLVFLAYVTWNVVASGITIAVLYGGLGQGVAVGLTACWAIVVLLTVPLSVWGLASTRRSRRRGRVRSAAAVILVAGVVGLWSAVADGRAEAAITVPLEQLVQATKAGVRSGAAPSGGEVSLATSEIAACQQVPGPGVVTAIVTYAVAGPVRPQPVVRCLQAPTVAEAIDRLDDQVAAAVAGTPLKIDWVSAVSRWPSLPPVVDGLFLRPGIDGACAGARCLAPWQLLAEDVFTTHAPLDPVPELRFGVDLEALRARLAGELNGDEGGVLRRIETLSMARDSHGRWRVLRRMRTPVALSRETVNNAAQAAQEHIVSAQAQDGRFRYLLDPFTGRVSFRGFSVPRQAGTTMVLCELGDEQPAVDTAIEKSLAMLATLEQQHGDLSALFFPAGKNARRVSLGTTALSLIAFASCRDRVGSEHDALMGKMARFLLAMQREDGGFHPKFHMRRGQPLEGPEPMFAGGQAVLALVLVERHALRDNSAAFPRAPELRTAIDRAMDYYTTQYWPHFAGQFFYLEENWHCLAARAALQHHRDAAYEQFCLDYVEFKRRLILDEDSRVVDDFVGGYGFGNVLPPHNTAAAGFGEALAAAMAIREARGTERVADRESMALVLRFLLHHQWRDENCFACTDDHPVAGAWSENMASPQIRIDYVQHAWAAIGHGGHMLDLVARGPT